MLSLIVACIALVVVVGNSYTMASRPAWGSILGACALIGSLIGAAAVLGTATFCVLDALKDGEADAFCGNLAIGGVVVNAVATLGLRTPKAALLMCFFSLGCVDGLLIVASGACAMRACADAV